MSKTFGSSREAVKNNSIFQFQSKNPGPGTYRSRSTLSDIRYSMRPKTNNGFLSMLNKVAPGPGTYEKYDSISKSGKFVTSKFRTYGITIINPDQGVKQKGNRGIPYSIVTSPWAGQLPPQGQPPQQGAHQTQHQLWLLLQQESALPQPEEGVWHSGAWSGNLQGQE